MLYFKKITYVKANMLFSEKNFRFLKTIIKWIGVIVALIDALYLLLSRKKKFKEFWQRSDQSSNDGYHNKSQL